MSSNILSADYSVSPSSAESEPVATGQLFSPSSPASRPDELRKITSKQRHENVSARDGDQRRHQRHITTAVLTLGERIAAERKRALDDRLFDDVHVDNDTMEAITDGLTGGAISTSPGSGQEFGDAA